MLLLFIVPALGHAQTSNRAGLVVVKGDGSVQTACVAFDEPTISGLALLERSGFDIAVQPAGSNATVCSIAGEGCAFPREACWCQCAGGGPCSYWQYWHRNGGAWQYAATGAPLYRVPPNGVDAWVWGESAGNSVSRPPEIAFDAICAVPAAKPTLVLPPPTEAPPPTAAPPTATRLSVAQSTVTQPRPSATLPPTTRTSTRQPEAIPAQPTATSTLAPIQSPTLETTQAPAGAALADTATATASPLPPTSTALPSPTAMTVPIPPIPTERPSAARTSSTTDYVLFGGTACVLLLALTAAWHRRR